MGDERINFEDEERSCRTEIRLSLRELTMFKRLKHVQGMANSVSGYIRHLALVQLRYLIGKHSEYRRLVGDLLVGKEEPTTKSKRKKKTGSDVLTTIRGILLKYAPSPVSLKDLELEATLTPDKIRTAIANDLNIKEYTERGVIQFKLLLIPLDVMQVGVNYTIEKLATMTGRSINETLSLVTSTPLIKRTNVPVGGGSIEMFAKEV